MSLETNLELNNKLLTQHNALLERLITALASGVALRPDTVAQVQEYRETAPETGGGVPALDDLEFGDVVALAVFYPEPQVLGLTMLQRAIDYRDTTGDARVVQIDALDMALRGVKRANHLSKPALLDLARHVIRFWDDLPTIGSRREFAEQLLDTKAGERDGVKPKRAGGKTKQQERKGPFFVQHDDGKIGELSTKAELKTHLDAGYTEINKVEYLQLKEDAEKASDKPSDDQPDFAALRKQAEGLILQLAKGGYRAEAVAILEKQGAKKLGEVADEDLADVVAQAEKALEG
ncbi:hypothetical protein GTGU_01439 [Trabulsiella guamensis ATCC 49490]|uniref:Uncharacterized protein n=1 Tax=Trabulsiella guamensis ATCC 49490 TaxID=1005994 RepID=A0A085ADN1_9ENTR|nr:hypothetical protein [Trabulsiella guamensis]KFC08326.1 hypothetical protein GTGU_01439 [Trabulsiella guamensis ATCC 49490]